VYNLQRTTEATRRHLIIRAFQDSTTGEGGLKVLLATLRVAAVGITLTAANRVYMLEPTIDPQTAVQAAGRIHRLGQSREVHIVQLAYRNTLDVALLSAHDRVRSGSLTLRDGSFPPALVEIFRAHGVGRPHSYAARDNSADRDKIEKLVASGRQPVLTARDVPPRRKWDECTCCGHVVKRMEFREKTLHSQAGWRAVQSFYTVGAPNFAARYPGPLPGAGVYQGKARKVYKDEDGDDEDDEDEEDDDEDDEDD